MDFKIDINKNILKQFSKQLSVDISNNALQTPMDFGKGGIELINFPHDIELYHVNFNLNNPTTLQSFNPENSDWILLNINLSKSALTKTVNNEELNFQKFLPSGILFYTRNTKVFSQSPANIDFEVILIRIPRDFFTEYEAELLKNLQSSQNAILYEDLNYKMEKALLNTIATKKNKIRAFSFLMQFLADLIDKFNLRDTEGNYDHLHPNDIKGLFMSAAFLRDPLAKHIPSITELAEIAGMGTTKFKNTFKQVFGKAPIQYHQSIRFGYAREELENKRKTPSELSYELGYSHPSKFTMAYKKMFGELPSVTN